MNVISKCYSEIATILKFIAQQFHNPLMYLLCASAVVMSISGDIVDGCIVAVVIVLNVIIGTVQEYRLSKIVMYLQESAHRHYVVMRDDKRFMCEEKNILVGDVVVLQDGQMVPADGRILVAHDLLVDESMLTGESGPVSKDIIAVEEDNIARKHDKKSFLFAGTGLVTGYAHLKVTAIGKGTERSKLRRNPGDQVTELPLQKDLSSLIRFILITIVCICAGLFVVGLIDGKPISELLAALLALFMCAVPQGLPVIMTVILAVGSYRLSLHKILVKRLQAVETLGRADLLVVDKTGTLTTNELVVYKIVAGKEKFNVTGSGYDSQGEIVTLENSDQALSVQNKKDEAFLHLMYAATLLDSSHVFFNEQEKRFVVKGNPNEAALGVCAKKFGMISQDIEKQYQLLHEIPFHADKQIHIGYYKDVLNQTGIMYAAGTVQAVCNTAVAKKEFNTTDLDHALQDGMRIVAVGYATCNLEEFENIPEDLTQKKTYLFNLFMRGYTVPGFFCVQDALKNDVVLTIQAIKDAGIMVVMATGDHAVTALQVAQATGITPPDGKVFDVSLHTPEQLQESIGAYTVYARCLPEEKASIVQAFKKQKHLTVMMGDGANDVPALVAADLAICMGKGGSDSAKEIANVVVLDDAFSAIAFSVSEGRHILYTFKRVVFYFLVSNLTEVLVMVVAFVGYPIPLLASHILWLNLLTDGFLDATLSLEQQDVDVVRSGFKDQIKTLISNYMVAHVMALAVISAAITAYIFIYYLAQHDLRYARTMCVATLTVCQMINSISSRSLHKSVFRLPLWGNTWLYAALVAILVMLISCMYVPSLQKIFVLQPLEFFDWVVLSGVALVLLCIEEVRKLVLLGYTKITG